MFYIGIDVSKDKHDCFCCNDDLQPVFQFQFSNDSIGFNLLFKAIKSLDSSFDNIKIALEATGHYSYNITSFILDNDLPLAIINPLHSNLFRKSISLRKTKTDKVDACVLARMLIAYPDLKFSTSLDDNDIILSELKSLTRFRLSLVKDLSKLKTSLSRIINIVFPEIEKVFSSTNSLYELLYNFPSAKEIANAHLTKLTNVLIKASKGHFSKEKAVQIKKLAQNTVGNSSYALTLELKHTIKLINEYNSSIDKINKEITTIMDKIASPITSIPGIGITLASIIIAEISNFDNFDSPDKILAFAGMSPTIYQSGKYVASSAKMEKRGSKALRYALYNAARLTSIYCPVFKEHLARKRSQGKHFNVAISHVVKKLVRVIYHLQTKNELFKNIIN